MELNFIEIGTADFATIIESCNENAYGISVEPLKVYLDRLPDKPNVKKVNAAIVDDESISSIDTYFVREEDIYKYNLGGWLKGCNSVGKPHDFHVGYYNDPGEWHRNKNRGKLPKRNLLDEGIVTCVNVPCLTFEKLMVENNITYVALIKIDTEGQDSKLINSIIEFYKKTKMKLPRKITFETNAHNDPKEVNKVCKKLIKMGYELNGWIKDENKFDTLNYHDCIAELINY